MNLSRRARRLLWPLVGLSLWLLAVQPLLTGHLPWRGDGSLHFYRLLEVERAAGYGELFPAWAPDLGYGYGFPLFRYYAPLSYLVLLPFRWLGLSTSGAFLVGYGLALALVALGLVGWSRSHVGRAPALALVAPIAAVYAPYLLFNVYQRGAYAEVWGLAWLSLGLWAMRRAASGPGLLPLAGVALTTTGLALSHNISALVGLPMLAGYGLLESLAERAGGSRSARTFRALGPLLLGLGLAAIFWLPAWAERDAILLDRLLDGANFDFRSHFLSWRDLLALPRAAEPDRVNPPWPLSLGWPQLLAAALAWWPARRPLPGSWRRARVGLTAALALLLFLMLPLSAPVWAALPLLPLVQFPWRLLGPAALCLAALAGIAAWRLGRRAVTPLIALFLVGALPWLFPARSLDPPDPAPADLIRFEAETGFLGTTSAADFLPRDVTELPAATSLLPAYEAAGPEGLIDRLDPASLPAGAALLSSAEAWNVSTATVDSPAAYTARFRRFAFPGWSLTLDGAPAAWRPSAGLGLIEADVPAGRHTLRLAFSPTADVRLGQVISLVSLVVLVAVVGAGLRRRRHGAPRAPDAAALPELPGRAWLGPVLLALGLLLPLAKCAWLDRADTPFRRARLAGDVVLGVGEPVRASFGDDLELLAAELPGAPVPADQPLPVTLAWRALPPVQKELSVSLQLEDDQGRRIGQSDHQHPAGLPVTRWLPGEYALDEHALGAYAGTPPGRYTLWLQVYQTASGELVSRRDAAGRPVGPRLELGTIVLARPTAPPTLLELPLETTGPFAEPGDGARLLGRGSLPEAVAVGEPLVFTLYWGATAAPARSESARLRLVDRAGRTVATQVHVPPRADFPPSLWLEGDVWRDEVAWRVPVLADSPVGDVPPGPLGAGTYALRLALLDARGAVVGLEIDLGRVDVTVPARSFTRLEPRQALGVQFGAVAALLGYDLAPSEAAPGEKLDLTLYWESLAVAETSFSVFVQLLRDGEILAQHDGPPLGGARPTTSWLPGEFLVDRVELRLPGDAMPGDYALLVGMYDPGDGQRLTTGDGADAITLPDRVEIRGAADGP